MPACPFNHPTSAPWREGLSPEQAAVVQDTHPRLLVLAGAGSGKTRTLVARVAELLANAALPPSSLRIFSFTRQACQELEARLSQLWSSLGRTEPLPRLAYTFHAFAWEQLRRHRQAVGLPPSLCLLTQPDAVLAHFTRFLGETRPTLPPGSPQTLLQALRPGARALPDPRLTFLTPLFLSWKQRQGLLELEDLVPLTLKLLQSPAGGALRQSLKALLVDEFQDIDPQQWQLVEALLTPQTQLALFGDDDQAIYRWRGSEPTLIRTVHDKPEFKTHLLTVNYRCTGNILALAAQIMGRDPLRVPRPARAQRPPGVLPQLRFSPQPLEEVRRIVQHELARGCPPEALAVLLRERRHLEQVLSYLRAAKIPTRQEEDPPETRGVRLMTLHASKGLEFPVVILPRFDRGHFPGTRKLKQHEQGLLMRLTRARRAERLLKQAARQQQLLAWLHRLLSTFGKLGKHLSQTLALPLSRWHRTHASKLAEAEALAPWHPVLTRAWQAWPQERLAQLSEERRLCYVAMTRAQDRLWLISTSWHQRSPYLDEVAAERVEGLTPGRSLSFMTRLQTWSKHLLSDRCSRLDPTAEANVEAPVGPSDGSLAAPDPSSRRLSPQSHLFFKRLVRYRPDRSGPLTASLGGC